MGERRYLHAGATCDIVYDPERFSLSQADKDGTVMFLANAYQEYCSASESIRPKIIQRFVRSWFIGAIELPESFDDLHPDLLPVVRTPTISTWPTLKQQRAPYCPIKFWASTWTGLVYDLPQAMRPITQENLDGWGVTFYEAMEAAHHNLTQLQHAFIGPKEGEGVYLCAANDGYASSRLLLLDVIRQLRVAGDPVAMVANPETLIVTGSEDLDGLKGMLRLAMNSLQQPRPISGMAVRLDGDEWVPWLPDPSHPLFNEFRGLQLQSLGRDYAQQKEVLDGTTDKDTFVASFSIVQHPETKRFMTYCIWPKGGLTFLPRTDRIAFMQEGKDPVMADWNRVVEVMCDSVTPMDIYPQRFRVSGFPTEEQLAAMGATKP